MGKVSLYTIILLFLALISACSDSDFTRSHATAEEVMQDFYEAEGRAEDMLMDPLIVNSEIVKARVIEEIKNKSMDKRRYAIAYLGNEKILDALPTLSSILEDKSEIDYFRADALESIYLIDKKKGLSEANKYIERNDFLGKIAKEINSGTYERDIRSYWEAKNGVHE